MLFNPPVHKFIMLAHLLQYEIHLFYLCLYGCNREGWGITLNGRNMAALRRSRKQMTHGIRTSGLGLRAEKVTTSLGLRSNAAIMVMRRWNIFPLKVHLGLWSRPAANQVVTLECCVWNLWQC